MKSRNIRKIISFISSFNLLLQSFLPLAIAMPVYAEDASPAAIVEVSPTPEVTPEITPEATPEPTAEITPAEQQNNQEPQDNSPPAEQNNTPAATPTPEPTIVLPQSLSLISQLEQEAPTISPTLSTDKSDYFPTDTVYVSGTNFLPNTTYKFHVYSFDAPTFSSNPEITADENGNVSFSFRLDGNYRPNYTIEAIDQNGNIVSSFSFTDDRTINSILLNSNPTVTVGKSETISVSIQASTDWWWFGDNDWKSTDWRIGDSGSWNCEIHGNHTDDGTYTEIFNVISPNADGVYDISFRAYSDNSCSSGQSSEKTLSDAVTVSSLVTPPVLPNNPADDYALTSVSGVWTSVTGGSNVSGINTEEVRWGTTQGQKSGLRFDGSGVQTFNTGTTFYLGALTHFNYPIQNPSSGAKLKITLQFSKPTVSPNPSFSYDFVIDETTNSWPCNSGWQSSNVACDDRVRFPSSYGSTSFQIDDKLYTLRIDGFVNSYPGGSPVAQFVTQEEKNNTAYLVGSLSSVLVSAPQISLVEKAVGGDDADSTPGQNLYVGDTAHFTYVVQNTGNVDMTNVSVIDDQGVVVTCPQTTLVSGASMTCTGTSTVVAGQYTNTAHVHGTYNSTVYQSNNESANYFGIVRNVCGDGNKSSSEACDAGANNGTVCTPTYNNTCTYCSVSCEIQTVVGPKCGDYNIDAGETCDDGNIVSGDHCSSTCQTETWCGDGIKNGSEACDGSDLGGLSSSDFSCNSCSLELIEPKVTICHAKDSQKKPYETNQPNKSADVSGHDGHDGGVWYLGIADHSWGDIIPPFSYIGGTYPGQNWTVEGQAIFNNGCAIANYCGDGVVGGTEACDDGNSVNTDSCTNACTVAACGDGFLYPESEACDDGNSINTDACTNSCTLPVCGDGYVQSGEVCDDGNRVDTDACRNNCTFPVCGDGVLSMSEECDEGAENDTTCTPAYGGSCTYCHATECKNYTITGPYCGDKTKNGEEQCDGTDGVGAHQICNDQCILETLPYCGDGIKDTGEDCDGTDGITAGSNFCSTSCHLVPIYSGDNVCSNGYVKGEKLANKTISSSNPTGEVLGLASGKEYLFEVNGTFIPTSAFGYLSDAAFTWVNGSLSPLYGINAAAPGLGAHSLLGNLGQGVGIIKWNNVSDHTYSFAYTPTNSSQQFVIGDRYGDWFNTAWQNQAGVSDNRGSLNLDVYDCVNPTGKITVIKNVDTNADRVIEIENSTDWTWDINDGEQNISTGQSRTLGIGNYSISEDQQDGYTLVSWSCTDGTYGTTNSIPVAFNKNGDDITCTLTNVRDTGSIVVNKYIDADGDINTTSDQTLSANWQFDVDGLDLDTTDALAQYTGSTGSATFADLKTGGYTVIETKQTGFDLVSANCGVENGSFDGTDSVDNVQVVKGEATTCTFYNTPNSTIHGYKWSDVDGDGQKDSEETLLSGWTINLYKSDGEVFGTTPIATMNTSEGQHTGWYWFENLLPGQYKVCETLKTGWSQTYPQNTDKDTCHYVSLPDGSSGTLFEDSASGNTYNFGNIQLGKINVTKYNDLDGDGSQDENERVLGGWTISLSDNENQVTGENGKVSYNDLNPNRSYTLSENIQGGWIQTNISCTVNNSGEGVKITAQGEAYGHHGNCGGWNGCGDAATCAQWACQAKGYANLVSYGESKPCTQFSNCNLFNSGANNGVDYNWGNWCEVAGVTDIVCSNFTGDSYSGERLPLYAGNDPENSRNLNVNAGDIINCSIGNHRVEPKLKISRSNNATSSLTPGGSVEHTITIKVEDNNISNLKLTDLLPNGFKFRAGSYSVMKNGTDVVTLAHDPEYHSPGVWELGNFNKNDVITIKYLADISGDVEPGTYPDLASAIANDAYEQGLSFLAIGENSKYVDENFVGTDVEIVKSQTRDDSYNVEKEEIIKGEVLGASTSLPATGASPMWLMLAFISLVYGIRLIKSSNKK